jgi:hypothetical protein
MAPDNAHGTVGRTAPDLIHTTTPEIATKPIAKCPITI